MQTIDETRRRALLTVDDVAAIMNRRPKANCVVVSARDSETRVRVEVANANVSH